MNRHMLSGIALLCTWLIILWYGFDYFTLEGGIYDSVKIMPPEEKTIVFLWLAASITILAIAIRKIATPFLQKKMKSCQKTNNI